MAALLFCVQWVVKMAQSTRPTNTANGISRMTRPIRLNHIPAMVHLLVGCCCMGAV